VKWTLDPYANRFAQDKACCDIVNRDAVYADAKVIYDVLDNTTVAVNVVTGQFVADEDGRSGHRPVDNDGAARGTQQGVRWKQWG
jgi:lanthanide-dependent methanol dehydrogenase